MTGSSTRMRRACSSRRRRRRAGSTTVDGSSSCQPGGRACSFRDSRSISEAKVEQFVGCLVWELGSRNITVNVASPGPTETDMMQERYRPHTGGPMVPEK